MTVFVLLGPTAVGKTALSLQMAEMLGVPIINCDSRQIYREIPVCTAAPTAEEQARVQPDKCKVTNEKYTFRVWLMRLGMKGEEYKTARKLLLGNLKGHAAFRTKDQAEAAREKLKKQRAEAKEASICRKRCARPTWYFLS